MSSPFGWSSFSSLLWHIWGPCMWGEKTKEQAGKNTTHWNWSKHQSTTSHVTFGPIITRSWYEREKRQSSPWGTVHKEHWESLSRCILSLVRRLFALKSSTSYTGAFMQEQSAKGNTTGQDGVKTEMHDQIRRELRVSSSWRTIQGTQGKQGAELQWHSSTSLYLANVK